MTGLRSFLFVGTLVAATLGTGGVAPAQSPATVVKGPRSYVAEKLGTTAGTLPTPASSTTGGTPTPAAPANKGREIYVLLIADSMDQVLGNGFRESMVAVRGVFQGAFTQQLSKSNVHYIDVGVNSALTVSSLETAISQIGDGSGKDTAVFCF